MIVQRNTQEIRELNAIAVANHDAIYAFQSAIDCLENPVWAQRFKDFLNINLYHAAIMAAAVSSIGGTVSNASYLKRYLIEFRMQMAKLLGSDDAILRTLHALIDPLVQRYEATLATAAFDSTVASAIRKNLGESLGELDWITARINGDLERGEDFDPPSRRPSMISKPVRRRASHKRSKTAP